MSEDLAPEVAPLPDDWDEQAAFLAQSFVSPIELAPTDSSLLSEFAHLCLRFAHMEERVQGSILCELPAHLTVIRDEHPEVLAAEAEQLARHERQNLKLPDGPIEDLADVLDTRGVKVIECPRPPRRRAGAFLFHRNTGPALLCLCPVDTPAGRAVIAHEYCHLLADVDPYENRFCPPARSVARRVPPTPADSAVDLVFDELDVAELRAELFARAFLMPEDHYRRTLEMFGVQVGPRLSLARLADVAFYYGVEPALAVRRIADLGWIATSELQTLLAALGPESAPPGTRDAGLFPSPATRFVNLSLALILRGRISLEQMAYLLGIDPAAAQRLVSISEAATGQIEKGR